MSAKAPRRTGFRGVSCLSEPDGPSWHLLLSCYLHLGGPQWPHLTLFVNSNLPARLPPKGRVLSSPTRLVRQRCWRGQVFAQPTVSFAHKIFLSRQEIPRATEISFLRALETGSLRSGCHTDLVLASTLCLACSWLLLLVLTWRWGPAGGGGWEMEKQVLWCLFL